MSSTEEYQQQIYWNKEKPCFKPGDGSKMDLEARKWFKELEKKYWFPKELDDNN